jgi:hypothetical protein
MFCGYCGKENADDYSYCTDCGEPLENNYESNSEPKESGLNEHIQPQENTISQDDEIEQGNVIPAWDRFRSLVEKHFEGKLTERAEIASRDFWLHYENIHNGLCNDEITITIDPLFLANKHPEYGQSYHASRGWGIFLFVLGFIFIVSLPQVFWFGMAWTVLGIIIFSTAKDYSKEFSDELWEGLMWINSDKGMADLAANYIFGVVQLKGSSGSAHWPQHPSCVLSGKISFISDEKKTTRNTYFDASEKLSAELSDHKRIGSSDTSMVAVKQLILIILFLLLAYSNWQLIFSGDVFSTSPFLIPLKLIGNMFDTMVNIFTFIFS